MKTILFDLDGTITDPKVGITKSVAFALKSFGINITNLDDLCKFIGPPLKDSFCEYYGFNESDTDIAITKYREYFSEKGIFENIEYSGIKEMLRELSEQGKTLIIATSKPTVFAVKTLEHFDLIKYFKFVAGSELDGSRSKKSEVITYALSQNNITDFSSIIMVGDREHDIIGAKEVGIKSIGVLYGYGDIKELEKAKADYIVANVKELQSYLLGNVII